MDSEGGDEKLAILSVVLWILLVLVAGCVAFVAFQYRRFRKDLPKPPYKAPRLHPQPDTWTDRNLYVAWVGHSTLYIVWGGLRIITDPVFSEKVGVRLGGLFTIGPKRHTAPALALEEVAGKVDVILLSHAHMDHFDLPSLKALAGPGVRVVTAHGTGGLLQKRGFDCVSEMAIGDTLTLAEGLTLTSIPVRHWGARFPWNRTYGWTGYLLERGGKSVLFGGDTALTDSFRELRTQRPVDIACMPIGAYRPDSFQRAHCTPEQAWEMFLDSGARWLIPIHHDTFVLSREPVDEPLARLLKVAGAEAERVVIREHGDVFTLPLA